jgi:hypothetical protein
MNGRLESRPLLEYLVLPVAVSLISIVATLVINQRFTARHSLDLSTARYEDAPDAERPGDFYIVTALNNGDFTERGIALELFILGPGDREPFVPFMTSFPWSIADDVRVEEVASDDPAVAEYRVTLDRLNAGEWFQVQFSAEPGSKVMSSLRSEDFTTVGEGDVDLADIYAFSRPAATPEQAGAAVEGS